MTIFQRFQPSGGHGRRCCKPGVILFLALPFLNAAQTTSLPWLKNIDPNVQVKQVHTIQSAAEVAVSDGLLYRVNTLFHDKQRAVFQQIKSDQTTVLAIEGRYIWEYEGQAETEGSPWVEGFVLGHQFHAQILFFDKIHDSISQPKAARFAGQNCRVMTSAGVGGLGFNLYYLENAYPLGLEILPTGADTILVQFADWRPVSDILLPFTVLIDDGRRQFEYRYSKLIFNEGGLAAFRAPEEILSEEQKLLRLHRVIMDDHFWGQTAGMKSFSGDSTVIVSDGEVYKMAGSTSNAGLDRMMNNRDYVVYDDLIRPVVKISDDGSLGWVIVQVQAKGTRFDAEGTPAGPLEFVCAWVELYEKVGAAWKLVGNVSNFRPGRQ